MLWNQAAYDLLRGPTGSPDAASVEHGYGRRLPAAVAEWLTTGPEQLAAISDNVVTGFEGLTGDPVGRFLDAGYLLLETDSQYCRRWVTPIGTADDDPPVYLVDPDDYGCGSRRRYADRFSAYTHAQVWDALLWKDEVVTDFDHPVRATALDRLRAELVELPTTYGWAMNQECDAVYRFDGTARVGLAISAGTAVWSAISVPSRVWRQRLAGIIGAST